uniref:Odorant receptor n=1 Tax=Campoletis chlorideae TaxID=219166 RepID=A0A346D3Y0_9HYME|nr:odorant receptor [Campoletis chlorideae]
MSLEVKRPEPVDHVIIENKDYKSDLKFTVHYTRKLLGILGVWPLVKRNSQRRELIISSLLITTGMLLVSFVMVPVLGFIVMRVKSLSGFLKVFGPATVSSSNFVKYWIFIFRRNTLKLCFEHVENDWKMASTVLDREIMKKNAIRGRRVCILCMFFMYSTGIMYHTLMPIWRGKKAQALNKSGRILPYPVYDLYLNAQATPQFQIIFAVSCLTGCVLYTIRVASCSLVTIFVAHACGQVEIIRNRLDTLFDQLDDNIQLLNSRISFLVRTHVGLLRLVDTTQTALKEIFVVEVISATLIICLLEWRLTQWQTSDNVTIFTYFVVLISVTFNLIIFCCSGELLMEQCEDIGKATYLSDWWKMRGTNGRALCLLIAMANIPRKFSAAGMMDLSVASFGAIIRTSVAYLNMLRTFNV